MGLSLNAENRTSLGTPLISLNGSLDFYTSFLEYFLLAPAILLNKTADSLLPYSYVYTLSDGT